jgi:ABC-type metal ion transport system substrate-binding protein
MTIKDIFSNPKKLKVALKHYLLAHSFYSLDEFFSEQKTYAVFIT